MKSKLMPAIGADIKNEQRRPAEGKEAADLEPKRLGIRFIFSDHTNKTKIFAIVCVFLSLICIHGCTRKPKLDGLVSVRGTITFQGEGLEGAIVTFSPKEYQQGNRAAVATTDQKGRFELTTLGEKGAKPNLYRVSIVKNIAEKMEKPIPGKPPRRSKSVSVIPLRYNDEKKSGLEFVIDEKGMHDLNIELKDK